jgi:hypothetical protein
MFPYFLGKYFISFIAVIIRLFFLEQGSDSNSVLNLVEQNKYLHERLGRPGHIETIALHCWDTVLHAGFSEKKVPSQEPFLPLP